MRFSSYLWVAAATCLMVAGQAGADVVSDARSHVYAQPPVEDSPSDTPPAPPAPMPVNDGSDVAACEYHVSDAGHQKTECQKTECQKGGKGKGCGSCYLCGPDEAFTFCNNPCSPIKVGGWTQIGWHEESTGMFNSRPSETQLHQQWLYVEREADGSCGLDWGFRADFVYGTDGQDTQAFNNTSDTWDEGWDYGADYGTAIPQLYGELAYGDWSVIFGHFYTLVGYEVVTAPDNFFYSHAFTMYNSEPFTHTGALATYQLNCMTEVYGGYVLGWDTAFEQNEGSQIIGGFSRQLNERATLTYIYLWGDIGGAALAGLPGNPGLPGADGYNHSIVLDVAVSDNLNYVIQSDLVEYNDIGIGAVRGDFRTRGLNQYVTYSVNDCLAYGVRVEWWNLYNNTNGSHDDLYEVTLGMNYKPLANVTIRPEVRWDWDTNGVIVPNRNGTTVDGDPSFGVDMILTY